MSLMKPMRITNSTGPAICAALAITGVFGLAPASAQTTPATPANLQTAPAPGVPANVYHFTLNSLAGQPVDLAKYKGKVLLIVNTASKCGFTPQYAGLEKLNETYKGQGLEVLGFPSNDFHQQEPGTSADISEFCKLHYGVTFDMFEKIDVLGPNKAPLYAYLTEQAYPAMTGDISWNFEKFLVARDGQVVGRYKSRVTPDSPELISAIEAELKKPG